MLTSLLPLAASGQDEANPVFRLATQAGKMGLSYPPGISRVGPARKSSLFGHIMNPLLTKLVRLRWRDIGVVLFCVFIDRDFVSVHKERKKNLANIDLTLGQ